MSVLLHGTLEVEVSEAKDLPDLDTSFLSFSKKDVSDPFVVVALEDENKNSWKLCTTSVIDNDLNPVWNETFRVDICHVAANVIFTVKDKDFLSADTMGTVKFSTQSLLNGVQVDGRFPLVNEKGKQKPRDCHKCAGRNAVRVCYSQTRIEC